MTKYVLRDGVMVDKHTGAPIEHRYTELQCPQIRGDLPTYISPVTGKPVDGRAARREDLARSGCREVDPSEFKPEFRKEKYARKEWELARKRA